MLPFFTEARKSTPTSQSELLYRKRLIIFDCRVYYRCIFATSTYENMTAYQIPTFKIFCVDKSTVIAEHCNLHCSIEEVE